MSEEALSLTQDETKPFFSAVELAAAQRSPNKVVVTRPPTLGRTSVILIILNRMIGTGIFLTPTTLAKGTHSTAYTLLFWAAGGINAICGAHVFAEFGMTVPRLEIDGEPKQCVPRNGGVKNYVEYLLRNPTRLATCLYGIPFIVIGNPAGNSLICANCLLQTTGRNPTDAAVRGLAIGIISFACLMHAAWRKGGIWMFNALGMIKVGMLLTMVVLGVAYAAGALGGSNSIAASNLSIHNSTSNALQSPYGYAEAFLAVLFTYGGFHQATYVLGEVDDPRRKFKSTTILAVTGISILYMVVNLSYMMVVPEAEQYGSGADNVARLFFARIFGQNAYKVQNAFMSFSSFGNILVQTFTAARVKQELAKEGILPFTKFFANNRSLTPRRLQRADTEDFDNDTSDDTPVGALILHWIFTVLLILATISASIGESYGIIVTLYSFFVNAICGLAIGLGILVLRLKRSVQWSRKSTSNKYVSLGTAFVFTIANLFPLVAVWIKPSGTSGISQPIAWWATGTIGFGLVACGGLYWLGLNYVVPRLLGCELEVERESQFKRDHGYWVVWHEITAVTWRTKTHQT